MKRLLLALALLLALCAAALAGGVWYLGTAEADYGDDADLPGLAAPVEVWRDSLAVPHLWAGSEADLARALGYVHAQDRLWQMELFRRVADGRLAEILGAELVDTDRFLRTLGMGRAAAENERVLDAESLALLRAYAQGVNAWLSGHRGALPPEFVALRFSPEPWTPRHTLAISKIMAWDLADWEIGLDLQRAVDRVGPGLAETLYPGYPDWGTLILDGAGDRDAFPRTSALPLPRIPERALRLLDAVSIARASNAWVIGGERTRSGRPILANDPHLALRAPALWYLAALHGGRIDAAGATIPGVPAVVLGHTPRVAWGFTNAAIDDVDFFVEEVDPADSSRYRAPDGWRRFEVREETIQVRGADPVVHRVRATRHGPVLSGVESRAGGRVLAMRWSAMEPTQSMRAFVGMNRARSARELLDALRFMDSPHQNVVFADHAGRFGFWMTGRVPVRESGDGVLPVRGWTGEGEWLRYLRWDELPHTLDPAAGFIVTANNRQAGAEYPHFLGSNWAEPFRAMRIREMVEGGSGFTAAAVAAQQMDVRDAFARRYLPLALRAAESLGDAAALRELRAWNAEAAADSRAAALFYTWYEALRRRVGWDEFRGRGVFFPRYALNRLLDAGGGAWVDDVGTARRETLPELAEAAMREAIDTVGGRTWGELHATRMEHALGSAEALDRVLELNVGPFPTGGSPYTVNVAGYGSRPPFLNAHGASMRHVVDLGDPDGSGGFVVPTGQSGVPSSRHYRDQAPLWRQGRLWLIPLDRARASARAVERMTLRDGEG